MYREDTIEKFIELRAQGWSLGHIASELHTAKRTLVEWSREYAAHIQSLRALEQEFLQEKIVASREEDLARLLRLQKDVQDELANRTLRLVDTEKLFRMSTELREEIRKMRLEKDSEQQSSVGEANGQARGVVPATNGTLQR